MVGAKLTFTGGRRQPGSPVSVAALTAWAGALIATVGVAACLGTLPGGRALAAAVLGPGARIAPHATSPRTLGYAVGLLVNNATVALWPLAGLLLLDGPPGRWRRVFITVVGMSVARSVLPVAAALAVWGPRLVRYIPNAPFELAAITTGAVLYLHASARRTKAGTLRNGVFAVLLLLMIAAALETWAVPIH